MEEFDFIIVGAGSAGCVLAERLSADGSQRVLLLEAGGGDRDPLIHIPLGIGRMHERRRHDWGYDSEPEPGLNGRRIEAMRGKVLGGSSSINHMGHMRGHQGDYERWAARGLAGWSYSKVLPYFRRHERWEKGADAYRGGSGPIMVGFSRSTDPIFDAFAAAARAMGIPYTEDYNGACQEGVGRGQFAIGNGRRQSSASAYLRPALRRRNVTLRLHAHARRLVIEGGRARGVDYAQHGRRCRAYAARETILAAGVFHSPQLLMLSGIGPADHLKEHGITPLVDLPGVGRNLQDHLAVMVAAARPAPSPFRREMRFDRMAASMLRAHLFGSGPATVLPGGLHAFIRTEPGLAVPDIQFIFSGVAAKPHLWFPGVIKPYRDRCGVRAILLHPESQGQIRLRSADPFDKVRLSQNFLAAEGDLRTLRGGVRRARELLAQAALAPFRGEETAPGAKLVSDAEIDGWIRSSALTAHHPAGTCAMGTDARAVLDPELRVRGVDGLRVVDASAMPDLVSGNINACVVMIAEKASDHILGRPPPAA